MQQQSQGRRLLVVLLLLALCCCGADGAGAVVWRHAVIVDAGSTGSRAHVFRWALCVYVCRPAATPHVAVPRSSPDTPELSRTPTHARRYQPHAPRAAAGLGQSPYPRVDLPEAVLKTTPGLSAFASNPAAAAQSLKPLIEFAKGKVRLLL